MKGYFSSLAKQSSVSIRGGRTSQARLPQAPRPETLAPLHSETVLFVDPTPTTVRLVNDNQTPEVGSLQAISQHSPVPIEGPAISSQSRSTGRSLATPALSNSTHRSRTGDTLGPVAPFENSFSMTNSPKVAIESPEKSEAPLVERPDLEVEGAPPKKGGVIRVGESESPIELKTESSSELFPVATSIPHEYLEGIREWLGAPPIEIEDSARRRTLQQSPESGFVTTKNSGESGRPTLVESDGPPQNEIQEFSLSIGSISIVVEEPPAPKQPANLAQPQTPVAVSPAPPAHDAFALSRRYFRGF